MSEILSWVEGTAGLSVLLGASIVISGARPFASLGERERNRLVIAALLAMAVQAAHSFEEYLTGFWTAFPRALGLSPWSRTTFATFNVAWLVIWLVSLREAKRGRRFAEWPLWFLALALAVNGVAHPVLALRARGYFPGLWTSPPALLAGLLLLRELMEVSRGASPGPRMRAGPPT